MYIGYIEDRKSMGYDVLLDTSCGIKLVSSTNSTLLMIMNFPSKVNGKTKRIILVIALVGGLWLSDVQPSSAMGLSMPPAPMVRVHPSYEHPSEVKIAPTVNPRLDKIYFMPNKEMIPLIYLNAKNVYINERVLKRLRAGGFEETLALMAIGVIVFLTFQLSGTDAFAILEQFGKLNAPTTNPGFAPGPGPGVISKPVQRQKSTAVQLYAPSHTQASTFVNADQSVNLDLGYQEVLRRARYSDNFNCSFDRFRELSAEDGQTTSDSMRAAISALQL